VLRKEKSSPATQDHIKLAPLYIGEDWQLDPNIYERLDKGQLGKFNIDACTDAAGKNSLASKHFEGNALECSWSGKILSFRILKNMRI